MQCQLTMPMLAVNDLAVHDTARQVLNLLEVGLEVGLDPRSELFTTHKVALRRARAPDLSSEAAWLSAAAKRHGRSPWRR